MPVIVKSGLHVVGDFEIASGAITIGEVLTNISGQPVTISGQHVYVESGTHVVGDFPTVESGLGVVIQSGIGVIGDLTATVDSGLGVMVQSGIGVIGDFSTTVESGLHVVVESGIGVVGDFTAEVSVSGQPVTISGQTVVVGSGLNVVGDFSTEVASGLHVVAEIASGAISIGEVTTNISGQSVTISGQTVVVGSGLNVVGDFSTEVASGLHVVVESGIGVVGDFTTEVASGLHVIEGPATEIKTGNIRTLTAASGGEVLHSGAVLALEVMALDTNACDIYLAGINNRPYSGFGYPLQAGATKNMTINDFGALYLFPACSGDKVGFIGII